MEMLTIDKNQKIYRIIEMYAESMPWITKELQNTGDMTCLYQRMLEMAGAIQKESECEKKEITRNDDLKEILSMVSEDILRELRKDPAFLGNRKSLNIVAWRAGFLLALTPDVTCRRINQKLAWLSILLIRYDQKKYVHPGEEMIRLLILIFDGLDVQSAEEVLDSILEQSGAGTWFPAASAGASQVCSFAHPFDSELIRLLDTPMVNLIFRNVVNVRADLNFGQLLASGIAVNERNYPEVNAVVNDCAKKLNIPRPYVVVSSQLPGINAMTFGSDGKPYLVISAMLEKVMNEEQLRFVIGHECGHIAMGHVLYHTAAGMLAVFGQKSIILGKSLALGLNAWSRRSEITADRAGLICCGNLDTAKKAFVQMECAFKNVEDLDIDAYIQGSRSYLEQGCLRRVGEYSLDHPLTPKRIEALTEFAGSRMYYRAIQTEAPETAISDYVLADHIEQILKVV